MPSLTEGAAASYRISVVRDAQRADTPWLAEVEGLPECSAHAATPEEAMQRAWRAVQAAVGEEAAEPASPPAPRHSGKLLVRMPATLHDELARAAEAEGVSLNQLITGVLASAVEWRSSDGRLRPTASAEAVRLPYDDQRRTTRIVLLANLAVVGVAALLAIVLLVVAWSTGIS